MTTPPIKTKAELMKLIQDVSERIDEENRAYVKRIQDFVEAIHAATPQLKAQAVWFGKSCVIELLPGPGHNPIQIATVSLRYNCEFNAVPSDKIQTASSPEELWGFLVALALTDDFKRLLHDTIMPVPPVAAQDSTSPA
jgi:hypothetical protein